jgi:hypothetical protein
MIRWIILERSQTAGEKGLRAQGTEKYALINGK